MVCVGPGAYLIQVLAATTLWFHPVALFSDFAALKASRIDIHDSIAGYVAAMAVPVHRLDLRQTGPGFLS